MDLLFKKIALFARRGNVPVDEMNSLIQFFKNTGREVLLEKAASETLGLEGGYTLKEMGQKADLAVIFGGDGTMLGVSRRLVAEDIPVLGINAGHLGFITDIGRDTMFEELQEVFDGKYTVDSRRLLQADLYRNNELINSGIALNEICVSRGISGGMVELGVSVNDMPLCVQRADGLIFSTPTGSTAYGLSVGGPLICPTVPCILMVAVAPHTLNNRPLILAEESKIELNVLNIRDAVLYYDMQDYIELQENDRIVIKPYEFPLHFVHPQSHSFFDTINRKLHWNLMPTTRSTP